MNEYDVIVMWNECEKIAKELNYTILHHNNYYIINNPSKISSCVFMADKIYQFYTGCILILSKLKPNSNLIKQYEDMFRLREDWE